jgi:hypothetical protein
MDKSEIKQGSFIKQTQYCIPVEIDLLSDTSENWQVDLVLRDVRRDKWTN